ncbi:MAG: hypothetical protein ABDH28_00875 [Brevinematia bacterium]
MKKTIAILTYLSTIILYSGCSAGFYQYPRTLEEGKFEIGVGTFFSIFQVPSYIYPSYEYTNQLSFVGYPDLFLRYGISDNVDVGIRLWGLMGFLSDIKLQFLGDKDSLFASSADLEFGATFVPIPTYPGTTPGGLMALSIALLGDVMPSKDLGFYFGAKVRLTYVPSPFTYYTPNPVPPTSLGLTSIFTAGVLLLNSYNYNVIFEVNFMKSILSEKWALGPCIGVKIKF